MSGKVMRQSTQRIVFLTLLTFLGISSGTQAASAPDWSEGTLITAPRANPYSLEKEEFETRRTAGLRHTLEYPVTISGSYIPWRPLENFLDHPSPNPLREILKAAFKGFAKIGSTDDLFAQLGLHSFPKTEEEGSLEIPTPRAGTPEVRMGVTLTTIHSTPAFTVSCAACHSSNLFGKKILGLTNRFPTANEFFFVGKKIVNLVPGPVFSAAVGLTPDEERLYTRFRTRLHSIGVRAPMALGLDTSLAQVALSLARRSDDEYASFDRERERSPREEPLEHYPADSKPAVWWNLKYKNRWLSDGSVVSGNPVYTNFLWNEIGRGTDLRELENWLLENQSTVDELTTAVFSSEAPKFTHFFPAERVKIERAKRGEVLFNGNCADCHGTYVKAWNAPGADRLSLREKLETTEVRYFQKTPVEDVKTDPNRWMGMASLKKGLNPLAISKNNGIVIRTQKGYVPPPLVGIWARYPYLHNNSVPNLCSLFTRASDRPKTYWSGESIDREIDFDSECVGYPLGEKTPKSWKSKRDHLYDTRLPGMSNAGHDEGIFIRAGAEIYTNDEKLEMIEFLKTL